MPSTLSPAQQKVLILLAQGNTVAAAAEAVGVHRNTIANWRRTSPDFQQALITALYEQTRYWCDRMQALADFAVDNLKQILTDGKASPHVRLRASVVVLDKVTKPACAQPDLLRRCHTEEVTDLMADDITPDLVAAEIANEQIAAKEVSAPEPAVIKSAQKCTTRPPARASEPGRNTLCPCGSGLKHKRCCLGQLARAA